MTQNIHTDDIASRSTNGTSVFLNYDYFINNVSKKSKQSHLREMANIFANLAKGKVNISLGYPNIEAFPFRNINVSFKDGSSFNLEGQTLKEALQYGISEGNAKLRDWLKQLQNLVHGPRSWETNDVIMSCGCQEALSKIVATFLEPGDGVILQTPSYPGILSLLIPMNIEIIPAELDPEGIKIALLQRALAERLTSGKPMPKLMIVTPTGENPAGITIIDEQKKKIYELAYEYNFLIVEDDPYYYLNFSKENTRSFLFMDSGNRVIRLDSFSKIISPGLRLGFITGPNKFLQKIAIHLASSSIHPSGLSQAIIYETLTKWKFDGFLRHVDEVQIFYKMRRDTMLRAVEKYLKDLVDWTVPSAGFFLWVRLKFVTDSKKFAMKRCLNNLILITPGCEFFVDGEKPSSYIRLSYSAIAEDQIDLAFSKLASLIHEEMSEEK